MPFARLFRSRWAALIWALGMVWTAIDVADSTTPDTKTAPANASAAAAN